MSSSVTNVFSSVSKDVHTVDVMNHALFPVIKFLLEKCDEATDKFGFTRISVHSVDLEVEALIKQSFSATEHNINCSGDIDTFVVLAIQVLRIHLLELEKVSELCLDFTNRYITCLKQKMQTELLQSDLLQDGNEDVSNVSFTDIFVKH